MIEHYMDGRRVYTAAEAAALLGENVKTVQTRLLRAGATPAGWVNPRLAAYRPEDLGMSSPPAGSPTPTEEGTMSTITTVHRHEIVAMAMIHRIIPLPKGWERRTNDDWRGFDLLESPTGARVTVTWVDPIGTFETRRSALDIDAALVEPLAARYDEVLVGLDRAVNAALDAIEATGALLGGTIEDLRREAADDTISTEWRIDWKHPIASAQYLVDDLRWLIERRAAWREPAA